MALLPAAPADASEPVPRDEVRRLTVAVDKRDYADLCERPREGRPREYTVRFFPDVEVRAVAERIEPADAAGTVSFSGHEAGRPERTVFLHVTGACAAGDDPVMVDATYDRGDRVFRIAPLRTEPGKALVTEENPALRERPDGDDADEQYTPPGGGTAGPPRRAAAENPVVIDMVVGWTPRAEWAVGGVDGMLNRVAYAEAAINQAFADSGVKASVDIVDTYRAPYYGEEKAATVHEKLSNPREPQLGAEAARLREKYGADLVGMIVQVPSGASTGQGSLPMPPTAKTDDQAYSVTDVHSIVDWYNFGHEVGHNLGLFHDRATLDEQLGGQDYRPYLSAPYGTGYVTPDRRWHTLMAYSSACGRSCTAVNQYSNTHNTWWGQPLGDRYNNNALLAQQTTPIVAAYREPAKPRLRHGLTLGTAPAGGGTVRPTTWGPYRPGTGVTVTATPKPGYRFTGWTLDGERHHHTHPSFFLTMDRNRSLTAEFARM
ncbi:InlB B-repeat-containing protein [Streptomyces sp. NRRL B-1347]|uniref:InlB B-repeat-containing protein n=1 Tax=Streptomyces sp. NRRL B-1347 TaxID=1476877 RepID=UPI00131C2E01|nr:M12 family metallo-peptidase [Streptomyces sp. NRRL B-1347]